MPSKPQNAPQPDAGAAVDPLAEFREPTSDRYPGEQTDTPPEQESVSVAVITQDAWDQARAQMVAGWHADTVSLGFLHKGGNCGCHYLAGVALTAAMPAAPELEPQEV